MVKFQITRATWKLDFPEKQNINTTICAIPHTLYLYLFIHLMTNNEYTTVVPAMGGHPWDQAKVSVHDRWPLIRGTGWVELPQTHYTVHNSIMQHHQRYT